MVRRGAQGSTIIGVTLLLILLQPVYANGDDIHLGGIFFILLGGVVFFGGLVTVLYLLLRPESKQETEENDSE
jgi:hypothetical protein